MLIQFEVDNFLSIKDTATFNLESIQKDGNSFKSLNYNLLQSSVIYGANASGKSNLLKAMKLMTSLVLNRADVKQSADRLEHNPFLLNSKTRDTSTSFEIIFIIEETIFRYGFEYDNKIVYSEWLFSTPQKGKRESKLFYRDEDEFYINSTKFKEGRGLGKVTLDNHLFLWKCDNANGVISQKILLWFSRFNIIDGLDNSSYLNYTKRKLNDENFKQNILNLVKVADLGISALDVYEEQMSDEAFNKLELPQKIKQEIKSMGGLSKFNTVTQHNFFDDDNNNIGTIDFDLEKNESLGTQKFFALSAPIIDTLKYGKILVIDELDASLHPILTTYLIEMFHNKALNVNNAQLIFVTHDTNLLNRELFNREQIWFMEKDRYGASDLYSLVEYQEKNKNKNIEKKYFQGRYGAIPYIGQFSFKGFSDES